jgi:hypothetical protein
MNRVRRLRIHEVQLASDSKNRTSQNLFGFSIDTDSGALRSRGAQYKGIADTIVQLISPQHLGSNRAMSGSLTNLREQMTDTALAL